MYVVGLMEIGEERLGIGGAVLFTDEQYRDEQ